MFKRNFGISIILTACLLVGCGGGDGKSGGGAILGPTPFIGLWTLIAIHSVNLGGTGTSFTDTSTVNVNSNGSVTITSTDSDCGLTIAVNGNTMTYQADCIFTAATEDGAAPCVLTMTTQATIAGAQGSAFLSGSFGPKTLVCSAVAASFAGTLVGNQVVESDDDDDDGDDDETDTETDTES